MSSPPSLTDIAAKISDAAAKYPKDPPNTYPPDPALTAQKLELISLAKSMIFELMDGGMMTQAHSLQMAELVSIRSLMGMKVFEALPDAEGKVFGLEELSMKTGVEGKLLERLLRVCVGTGFVVQKKLGGKDEEGEGTGVGGLGGYGYGHSKFSRAYGSYPGLFFKLMHDEFLAPFTEFPKYVKTHGPKEPTSLYENPYSDYFNASNTGQTTWDIMAKDPDRWHTFQVGLGLADSLVPTTGYFDFEAVAVAEGEDRVALVDVGGGIGNKLSEILKASPKLRPESTVLQDQPSTIEIAKKESPAPKGVKMMEHDFWKEQPVKGAKAYFIRRVIHDYSDADSVKILSNLRAAMAPDSKVLIQEQIMPSIITNPELEANVAVLDVATMVMGGKERTEEGFRDILDQSGLELVKVWKAEMAPAGVVEAKIKA